MDSQILDMCLRKCLSSLDILNEKDLSIPQKACMNRCQIKFTQAYQYTKDQLNYQNYQVKKANDEYYKALQNPEEGFLDKLHNIYEENYGKAKTTPSSSQIN